MAAANAHVAEKALELIKVDYEVLAPVLSADEAMKDGAPAVHERLASLSNPGPAPRGATWMKTKRALAAI